MITAVSYTSLELWKASQFDSFYGCCSRTNERVILFYMYVCTLVGDIMFLFHVIVTDVVHYARLAAVTGNIFVNVCI